MTDTTYTVEPATTPPSPKFWAALALTTAASVIAAVCTGIIANPDLLGGLPPWAAAVIVFALPPIAAAAGAYAKRDPLRDAGAEHLALQESVNGESPHEDTLAGFDTAHEEDPPPDLPQPLRDALARLNERDELPDYVRDGLEASGYAIPGEA